MRQGKPGFGLRDYQLMRGAWTTKNKRTAGAGLLSWTRVFARTPAELGVEAYVTPPPEMASTVKAAAKFYGAGMVGAAPMNETYVNMRQGGKDIVFEDSDVPAVTAQKYVIP